jgi:periplasmic copper chaperone A
VRGRTLLCAALTALVVAPAATAHVTASPAEISVGYTYTAFSVPHGCDGSPTTGLTIQIPPGIAGVKPEVVAGWEISTKTGQLAEPVSIFGEENTEGVTEVTWTGGPLPDAHLQRFGLSFFASEELAGQTVFWKIVQPCEEGVNRWIEIPVEGEEEPEEPAAGIAFLASAEEEPAAETTTDEAAAAEETTTEEIAAAPAASSDGDDDSMSTVALIFGIAGLTAGLVALGVAVFRKPKPTS